MKNCNIGDVYVYTYNRNGRPGFSNVIIVLDDKDQDKKYTTFISSFSHTYGSLTDTTKIIHLHESSFENYTKL